MLPILFNTLAGSLLEPVLAWIIIPISNSLNLKFKIASSNSRAHLKSQNWSPSDTISLISFGALSWGALMEIVADFFSLSIISYPPL